MAMVVNKIVDQMKELHRDPLYLQAPKAAFTYWVAPDLVWDPTQRMMSLTMSSIMHQPPARDQLW